MELRQLKKGEKIMKKFMAVTLAAVAALTTVCLASCGGKNDNTKYVANKIAGVEVEQYGFAVGKNSSKKEEILAAMNKVIAATDIDTAVKYYTSVSKDEAPSVTLEFADLSDNTAGTLNVYTCSGFEPYEFIDANENVIGVDIYLMELVAEELNMKISVNDMDFDGIVGKVASEDNAIGAAGITINDDRKQSVDFSDPYFDSTQCIISKDSEAYTQLSQLAGKKIGVQKGTTGYLMVADAIENGELKGTGASIVEYDTGAVAFTALKQGKIDFVVIDELPAQKLVS